MKRFLTCLLALTLVLGCVFALASCGEEETPKTESKAESKNEEASSQDTVSESKDYVLAEGYKLYTKKDISFAYPEDWELTDGANPIMLDEMGNNFNLTYENANKENTQLYKTLSNDNFMEYFGNVFEAMGMNIKSYDVKRVTNAGGVEIIRCEYSISYQNINMNMYQFIIPGEKTHYNVTATEMTSISDEVKELFDSIRVK